MFKTKDPLIVIATDIQSVNNPQIDVGPEEEEKERLPTAAIKRAYTTQRRWMEKMLDKFALNDKSSQLDRPSIMRVIVDYFHPR